MNHEVPARFVRFVDLQLYNVRTRKEEPFVPQEAGKVAMYVCGLTVYDHAHLGHARTAVSFEVIRRWLERTYDVHFVQNVTDVEDKILDRARQLGVSPRDHARTWDQACLAAMRRLGVRDADVAPHVTTHIGPIIAFVQKLVAKGFAYATEQGNVYFDVPAYDAHADKKFSGMGYGSLSNRNYEDMAQGTRKAVQSDKKHPADFALWKASEKDIHPDGEWQSPWGKGRPGWHIECSVMSTKELGSTLDIHGGGQDLIFPHHENEIAQSQACTGQAPFANMWIHTGFLNVDGQKMSKSLGNYIVLTDLLNDMAKEGKDPEVLRLYFAQTHYRSRIDFSLQGLADAFEAHEKLERVRAKLHEAVSRKADPQVGDATIGRAANDLAHEFAAAMNQDIHTPTAVAALFKFGKASQKSLQDGVGWQAARAALETFEEMAKYLTIFQNPARVLDASEEATALLEAREAARAEKRWVDADRIRDELAALGLRVEDTEHGPRLERI